MSGEVAIAFGRLIETAMAWHGGQTSPLYSFGSTEKIHSETHRQGLIGEIVACLPERNDSILKDERKELLHLLNYVRHQPLN